MRAGALDAADVDAGFLGEPRASGEAKTRSPEPAARLPCSGASRAPQGAGFAEPQPAERCGASCGDGVRLRLRRLRFGFGAGAALPAPAAAAFTSSPSPASTAIT